ncbi:MAG: Ger(x)C family spore germination protein [Desulfotomaculaceae bacterium]|nr:Ger(x)C family spore germination protein [Desulfotomaculaceae bacterium]
MGLKVLILSMLIIAASLTQTGCWDHQEAEGLGIVLATALDQAPEGRVRLTAQIISPKGLVGGGQVGGGGGAVGGASSPYRNVSVEGSTIFDCIRLLSLESPRQLFFAHNQTILISEELARNRGIEEIIDFFDRNPQIRRSNWVLIAQSDISSIMELPGDITSTPSQRIPAIISEQWLSSYYPDIQLGDFLEALETEGSDAFAMGIQVVFNESEVRDKLAKGSSNGDQRQEPVGVLIKVGSTAVFNGNKLAGWLNEKESRGLLWVTGKVKGGVITVPCRTENGSREGQRLSLEILRNESKIEPELIDGELSVTVKIKASTNIQESECMEELDKPGAISSIEEALAGAIQLEVEAALAKAQQEYGSDIFGFGPAVHRKYPGVWKEIKADWQETYHDLPVYVEIDTRIARTGLVTKPVQVQ